jgi:putative ABC transport system permease protein
MVRTLIPALRGFRRTPAFTATALLTLALCLGANLTIFAVLDAVVLRPLPFPAADRLVSIYNTYPKAGVDRDGSSVTNYYERRGRIPALASLSLYRTGTAIVGEAGSSERASIMRVTPELFATLGVGPAQGRSFTEDETTAGNDAAVILTDAYWQQSLGGDPRAIGRQLRIDGVARTIVGVLPPSFRFLSSDARLYLPLATTLARRGPTERHSGSNSEMIGRLQPGATLAQLQSQIDAQNAALERTDPQAKLIADAGFRSVVAGLHDDHVAAIRPMLLLLQGGVLLLLAIGGVNLINLLLIRASGRAKELAVRQSLGAARRHIVWQVVVETVALTAAGGVLGLGVAAAGIRLVGALGVSRLPLGAHVALDWRLALVELAGAIALGVAIALPVAWFALRGALVGMLRSESRTGTASRATQRLREGFIVSQVTLAFVLLAGSGLLGVSLRRAMAVSPGFRPDHVLTGQLSLPRQSYRTEQAYVDFTDRLMEAVRRQPGITAVAAITNIPLSGNRIKSGLAVEGYVPSPGESVRGHYSYGVTGDYFAALGIPLLQGRVLTADDSHRASNVAVVDEDFARRYWPDASAIGHRVYEPGEITPEKTAYTIVGVVGAVKQADVTEGERLGAVYFPFAIRPDAAFYVVTRTTRDPGALAPALAKLVRSIDPELPMDGVRTMELRVSDSLVARRSPALLAGSFALVALLLAAIGTYGVLSSAVAQRRREIGVRLALGAQPRQIGREFLRFGASLLAIGTVLGVLGTWMAGRLMQAVLYDVPALHAPTLAGTAAVMAAVSLVACAIPARRAARVDPMVVLGSD